MSRPVLPYASRDPKRKQPFTKDMEIAALVCFAEAKRKKKSGFLRGEPEKLSLVSKLCYPVWLVPWENEYITVDGMGLFSFETAYQKLPDLDSFAAKIERSKKSYEQFINMLTQNQKTFEDFASSEKIALEGVLAEKQFYSAIFEYFKKEIASKETDIDESAFLEAKLAEKTAVEKIGKIVELWKKNHLDIEALQKTVSLLDSSVGMVQDELSKDIESIRSEYDSKIEEIRPIVEEKVNQLTSERDEKTKTIATVMDQQIETKTKEKAEYDRKLEKLIQEKTQFEQKKAAAKLRKDQVYVDRWKLRVRELDKQVSEVEKTVRRMQRTIDDTKKEKEKTLKQISESYQAMIKTETDKIPNLEIERDQKIAEIEQKIERIRAQTAAVVKQIQWLIDEKRRSNSTLKEIAVNWKLDGVTLIYIPFIAAYYLGETKQRFEFFGPVLASSHEGVFKKIRKKLFGFSLDSRISALLCQRSKALDKIFSQVLATRIEEDHELRNRLREKAERNNMLAEVNFNQTLTEGMDALIKEEWIKLEEKDEILKIYSS